jgi:hypothetical protein
MDIQTHENQIAIRLEPKLGEDFDASEISVCLDHTVDRIEPATG